MRTIKTASGKEVNIDNVDQEIWEAIGHEFGWLKTAEGANEMDNTPDYTEYAEELPSTDATSVGEEDKMENAESPVGNTVIDGINELQNKDNPAANIAEWQAERQDTSVDPTLEEFDQADNQQRDDRQMANLLQNQRMEKIEQNKQDKLNDQQEEMQDQIDEMDAIKQKEDQEDMQQQVVENVQKSVNNTYNSFSYSSNVVTIPLKKG